MFLPRALSTLTDAQNAIERLTEVSDELSCMGCRMTSSAGFRGGDHREDQSDRTIARRCNPSPERYVPMGIGRASFRESTSTQVKNEGTHQSRICKDGQAKDISSRSCGAVYRIKTQHGDSSRSAGSHSRACRKWQEQHLARSKTILFRLNRCLYRASSSVK